MQEVDDNNLIPNTKYYIQIVNLFTLRDQSGSGRLSGVFTRESDDIILGFSNISEIPGGNSGSGIRGSSFFYKGEIIVFKINEPTIRANQENRLRQEAMSESINNGIPAKGLGSDLAAGFFQRGRGKRMRTKKRRRTKSTKSKKIKK
jgi:hypothetical protein